METLITQIAQNLTNTLSPEKNLVSSATETLDHLSSIPAFPLALIAIVTGGDSQGQRIAAASYLKNFISRHNEGDPTFPKSRCEFRNQLVHAVLQVESTVLKVLVEALRLVVVTDFVKEDLWPELVPELRSAIQSSDLITGGGNCQWKTINALMIVQTTIKPFQYFLNPQHAREPVPPQLELIATEFLVPLHSMFHQFLEKAMSSEGREDVETERIILILCKCFYFAVRSHMPSAVRSFLPYLCRDLFGVLDSLNFNGVVEDASLLRMKSGKRSLLIFCALVTRHRKHADKLMPNIMTTVLKIVKQSPNVGRFDFLSERVVSLAFDVISHVLETGPGWRLVSPHFSSLLESSIFPALILTQKDITEWEEDADEYIRKNLPSDLDEISGWKDDSFTARKSAINLLGVLSMSKGPPMVSMSNNSSAASTKRKKGDKNNKGKQNRCSIGELLVMPFLSKFPVPSYATPSKISHDYYGVLMAYGGLQDFLKERNPEYTAILVRNRILPVYLLSPCLPYLVATANWVLGELASCLPEEMSAEIYYSLLKTLVMPDVGDISFYPVRASAAGAVSELLENDYQPSDWLALLQVLVNGTNNEDENEASLFFQILSTAIEVGQEKVAVHIPAIVSTIAVAIPKHIPPIPEPWPQVVEKGFAALAVMAQIWDDSLPDDDKDNQPNQELRLGSVTIAATFAHLLRQAWLSSMPPTEGATSGILPPPSCLDDASALLGAIMRYTTETDAILELKIPDLLVTWADLIADWHAWEEMEDMAVFDAIQEVVYLHRKCELKNFLVRRVPSPPSPPVPQSSIIENISAFVSEAIAAYPSATWRACSCAHSLLHVPRFSFETEGVKQSLAIAFTQAAFSRFKQIRSKPAAIWKPLLLVISSCYLCYPDYVESVLEKGEDKGFTMWASGLSYISTNSFEPGLSFESEIKLAVMTLTKVVEHLLGSASELTGVARDCFISLLEAVVHLKEVQEEEEEEEDGTEDDEDEDEEETDDEDSEEDEREETEEEFLERYAQAAVALENGMVAEEGDVDDQVQELELGDLDEIEEQSGILSLIAKHQQVLVKRQELPPQLITGFVNTFPQYASFFQT